MEVRPPHFFQLMLQEFTQAYFSQHHVETREKQLENKREPLFLTLYLIEGVIYFNKFCHEQFLKEIFFSNNKA